MSQNSTFYSATGQDKPITVYFVRHGQAVKGEGDDKRGPPLSDLGRRQAERLARRMSGVELNHIYASSMKRAHDTARLVHVYHQELPLTVLDDLREVSHYHFLSDLIPDDQAIKEYVRKERDAVVRFVNHVRHHHRQGDKILVACHGNIIRTLMPLMGGKEPAQSVLLEINNTAVCILDTWGNGEAVLLLSNCTKHLLPKQVT
jgi:broad specificity phosphatase PhoE